MDPNPNKYSDEEEDTNKRWNDYLNDTTDRTNQMWNSILYNQFVNEEIRCLHRKIHYMKEDTKQDKNSIFELEIEAKKIKRKLEKYEKLIEEPNKRKISEVSKWLSNEKRKKPKNYEKIKSDEVDRRLSSIFAQLNSIDDIIEFSNEPHRFDMLNNSKFQKLYKLIPSCIELKNIIGMNNVKENIFKQISYFLHGLNNSNEINHVVITGEPGVGKTTLAKIIAKIYLAMGFLKNDNFIEAKRSDLIGEYCGHTAVKTQKVINSIEGGVLFIDEVYSLGNREKRDAFTKECIDTINQNLTEKGDKFLCIIAGYKEEVQTCFFNYNKGLERRFPVRFNLESYNEKELKSILLKFMNDDGWSFKDTRIEASSDKQTSSDKQMTSDDTNDSKLLKLISKNKDLLKYQAGDLRTIFQLTKENYSLRLFKESILDGSGNKEILIEDLESGFTKLKKLRESTKEKIPDYLKGMYI